jgi:hypothetical protein
LRKSLVSHWKRVKSNDKNDKSVLQQFRVNLSSSEFTFTFMVTIIISVFVPARSRAVQKLKKWVRTGRDRVGTKTEIIIVTINIKVNPEEDKFASI